MTVVTRFEAHMCGHRPTRGDGSLENGRLGEEGVRPYGAGVTAGRPCPSSPRITKEAP